MNHKVQVFHSLTTPQDIFMDQFAPFSHPSISEPTNPPSWKMPASGTECVSLGNLAFVGEIQRQPSVM